MKRTPPTTKTPKSTSSAKPAAKSAAKPAAAAKKSLAKKPVAPKLLPRPQTVSVAPATPPASKQSQLIALLHSAPGATLAQMMMLTGWQAHYADVLVMPTNVGNPACVAEIAALGSA